VRPKYGTPISLVAETTVSILIVFMVL
jgi:hypothetical protein